MKQINFPIEVMDEQVPIRDGGTIYTPADDVRVLYWLVAKTSGAVVELGCNAGVTTSALAWRFPNKRFIGVDQVNVPLHEGQKTEPFLRRDRIGSCFWDMPNAFSLNMPTQSFDFWEFAPHTTLVFIDADHTYEGVKADTENAFKFLIEQPGERFLVWHDAFLQEHPKAPWIGVGKYLLDQDLVEPTFVRRSNIAFAKL